jgi:hypothetical protein
MPVKRLRVKTRTLFVGEEAVPRQTVPMKLLLIILAFSAPAYANEGTYPHCKKRTDRYHDMIERSNDKKQRCKKDSECVLLFEGKKLSWCDSGFALSKTAMGNSWLKKLERARKQAEDACPEPDANRATCAAQPAEKAKCVKNRCETG